MVQKKKRVLQNHYPYDHTLVGKKKNKKKDPDREAKI